MSDCSSSGSVTKYIIVEPSQNGSYSGLTVCGGGGLTVDFITGCTSDGVNVGGAIFDNGVLTVPTINAITLSGGTLYGDGSNLIGISSVDSYMTGGTYSNGFITFSGSGIFSEVSVDVSALIDDTNYYVTGSTLNGDNLELSRNGGLPTLTTDLSSINTDNYVSGGTYSNGNLLFSGTSSNQTFSVDVSALIDDTNYYVTGQTLNGTILETSRNGGLNTLNTDLSSLQFTGNTSGSCISNFHVSNIYGCSPITVHDNLIVNGTTIVLGFTADTVNISNTPNVNDTLTNILVRDIDGSINTRSLSSITGLTSSDNYVTGSTLNGNVLELSRNNGLSTLTTNFLPILSGFTSTDYYVTGATMNGNTLELGRNGLPDVTVNLSQFVDSDTSVTGLTYNPTTYDLTLSQDNGKPSYVSNLAALASDIFVLSGVYDISTGIVTYTTNSGTTFQVSGFTSGMTDSYTSSANLSGNEIQFNNNIQGANLYNVDLTPLLSGKTNNSDFYSYTASTQVILDTKTDNTDFWSHTGDTNNPHQTSFNNLTSTGHTHTLSEITDFSSYSGSVQTQINSKVDNFTFTSYTADTQNILNTKIDGGINVGGGHEIFSGITGTDMNFRTLSGGSNTTLSTIGDVIKIDVTIPASDNSFVTGGTVSGTDLVLGRNGGLSDVTIDTSAYFDNTDNYVTGATMNVNTLELSRSGGLPNVTVDLSQFVDDTNFYVTGSTMNGNTLELSRNGGLSTLTTDLSQFVDTDNFVTGATYSNGTITLSRQNGTVGVDIPDAYVTGATLNVNILELSRNEGLSTLTVDLSSLSPTGETVDRFVTGATMNGNTLELSRNQGLPDVTVDLSQFVDVDTFVSGGTYSGGSIFFSGNSVETTFNVDVSALIDDTNYYVTGGTVNGTNLELGRNGGLSDVIIDTSAYFDNTDNFITGGTMVGNTLVLNRTNALSAVTVDLSQFVDNTNDGVVSGATMNGNTLELGRTQGLPNVTVDLSQFVDTDSYVTGSTLNGNILELSRNGGLPTLTTDLSTLNPSTTLDRKLFIPAAMASTMGSSTLTYHGTTGVALLSFGGGNPDNNQGSFPMVVPQDYVSGGTFELIYTSQSTVNDIVWSFGITNASNGVDFSTLTDSGPYLDLVVSGQTFLNRGTSQPTTPTGTTFNTYDAVTVRVNRDASDSRDTANNITGYIYGLIFNYKANN